MSKTLTQKELYRVKPGTVIEATVTTKYVATAYERYDGGVGYTFTRDGIDQGSNSPSGLTILSDQWVEVAPKEEEAQTPVPEVKATPVETRAKTTPKEKAAPKSE